MAPVQPIVFINVTHPSQLQSQRVQTTVRSHSSKLNTRGIFIETVSSLPSTDEDDHATFTDLDQVERAKALRKAQLGVTRFGGIDARHQKAEQKGPHRNFVDEIEDEERIIRHGFDDVFSDFGDLAVPHLDNYPSRRRLTQVFEYYLRVFGPNNVWRTNQTNDGLGHFKHYFFAASMEQPVLLEALFAISQARIDSKALPETSQSVAALRHRGKALSMLQMSLKRSPDSVHDGVLLAVVIMMTVDAFYANWSSFKANLNGARHIITMKGGMENLGWYRWLKGFFMWAELRWIFHLANSAATQDDKTPLAVYPTHPFSPELCKAISRIPPGLADMTFSQSLSTEVIDLLQRVSTYREQYVERSLSQKEASSRYRVSTRLTINLVTVLATLKLKPIEQLTYIGVVAYMVSSDGCLPNIERMPRGLEDVMIDIERLCAGVDMATTPSLLWAAIMIAISSDSTMSPLPNRYFLLDRVLDLKLNADWTWKTVLVVLQRYFWEDAFNLRGEAAWQTAFERKQRRQAASVLGWDSRLLETTPPSQDASPQDFSIFGSDSESAGSPSWDAAPVMPIRNWMLR